MRLYRGRITKRFAKKYLGNRYWRKLLWATTLEEGDVVHTCAGYNKRVRIPPTGQKECEMRIMYEDLIEKVAKAIYHNSSGLTDEEYVKVMGEPRKKWRTDLPWDKDDVALCEWQRDEYRQMARAALAVVEEEVEG